MSVPQGSQTTRNSSRRHRASAFGSSVSKMLKLAVLLLVLAAVPLTGTLAKHITQEGPFDMSGIYVYDVSPQSGPTSGGSKVTLTVKGGALPEHEQYYFCKFGEQTVVADHLDIDGGSATVVCLTPETDTAKVVDVTFSVDGITYTKPAKKQFSFHKPLVMQTISPSVGSIGGGTSVLVSLLGDVVSRKTETSTLKPTCNFDGMTSRGTLVSNPEGSSISCTVPSIFTLGHTDLSVSLNGVDYSENTGNFTIVLTEEYNSVVQKVTTHAMAGDPVFHVNGTSATGEFYGFFDMKFYDFYGFYGPSKDIAYDKQSEVCMVAVSPSVGRNAGGTVVTIKLAGVIPEGQETFFCKFGDKVVVADSFYYTEDVSPAIVCTAPEFGSGAGAVELKISFDGITYTNSGSAFYYHDDVKLDNILPSSGTHIGGTTVGVRLSKSPMPSSFEVGLTSVPALCKFDTTEVGGQYVVTNDGPAVVCKTPASDMGIVNVKLSLDGQYFSSDSVAFTFSLDPDEINPDHRMAVSRYLVEAEPDNEMAAFKNESFYFYNGADGMGAMASQAEKELSFYEFYAFYDLGAVPFEGVAYKQREIKKVFDYLPFSPDYCLFFNAGPDTSLERLEISNGTLFPAFTPSTYVYVTSVVKEVDCLEIATFPTDKNVRSVTVAGHKVAVDSVSKCIPLTTGENLLDVVVTGQDGQTARTYSIVTVRLQGTSSSLENVTIASTATPNTLIDFSFDPETLSYMVPVSVATTEILFTPIPDDEDALVTTVVGGSMTYFGDNALTVSLNAGDNIFEITVEAEDGVKKTVYTVNVRRDSTDLLGLKMSTDEAQTNLFTLSPAFASSTSVYTVTAAPTDNKFYAKFDVTGGASVDVAYDIGAATYACPAGTLNQEGTFKDVDTSLVHGFCNPSGSNSLTITVKFGGTSTTYTVTVFRSSAAASLTTLVGSAGNFVPPFAADVYKYELILMHSTSAFTLTPTVGTGAQSTVTLAYGSNSFSLSSGSASSTISSSTTCGEMEKIFVTVTAEDGVTTATYEILPVKLAEGIHAQLSGIAFVNATAGSYVPSFQPSVTDYDFTVIRSHKTGSDTQVGTDPVSITFTWNAPVTYSNFGNFVGSTKEVKLIKGGVNTTIFTSTDTTYSSTQSFAAISGQPEDVQLEVTACDGRTKTTYDFDVMRGQASNAFMCNLVPSAGTFDTAFSKTDYLYKLDVAGDATSIGFTPTACDSFAKVEVGACSSSSKTAWTSGALYTKTLSSDFSVEQVSTAEFCVTSEDGQTAKTYSVTITRPLSSEALLKDLNIKLVKWDGSETLSSFTKATNADPEIPTTIALAATYEQAYIQVSASATINTAAITLTAGGVTTTLTQGTYSAVLPGASCVAPSMYYCDAAADLCPELLFGANAATITVTSQDGQKSKTYTATITRATITYEPTLQDLFVIGHPILGMTELVTASGMTQNALTQNFANVGIDTTAVSKYGSFIAGEHILTALKSKSSLPAAPTNTDARFRAVTSPHVQFLKDIADKMITDQTLVDRVSSGYTFGEVSSTTLGTTENDSSPRVYVEPLFTNPYQKVKVEGVIIEPGCGRSLEADFGDNVYKVETFDGQMTELKQYNLTVTRPYLSSGLLSGYVSTTALDQPFANTTFVYSTKVDDTEDEVTMSFTKYDSTSTVRAQLFYDNVLQSTVTATSAEKFALSPFGITKIVALVQTADGTDGGSYSFTFNKFPTVLTSLSTETAGGVALPLTPAFVDPSTVTTEVVQTSYALSEITETNVFLKATTLDTAATFTVKIGTTAVTAVAGKYDIPVGDDTVVVTVTVTASNGVDTRVYTLTISKEQKNAAAATSFVAIATTTETPTPNDPLTTFGAGLAKIPITGKTSAGKDALTGDFVCKITGDTTTFEQTFPSTFKSAGSFEVALPTVTIAGTYAYTCSLGGVALKHQLHTATTGQLTIVGGTLGDKSILSLVSTAAVRGSPVEFQIRTKDSYGNEVNTVVQATEFTVAVTQSTDGTVVPATFNTTQTANGVINWYFTPSMTYSGTYKVVVTVQVGGLATEIIGSDILLSTVIPVTAASGWEVAYSPAYQAGLAQNVVVKPKASTVASKDQEIFVGITGTTRSGAVNTVYSCDSRTTVQCTIPLGLTVTGNYTLNVTIGGALVGDSLHSITLTGGAVDLTKSQVVIPATAAAGTPFDASLKLFDAYSNPASLTGIVATAISASFTKGALSAAQTSVVTDCFFYNCEFRLTSTLTAEGTWKAVIKYQGTDIGVSKDVIVSAGSALASKTSVTVLQNQIVAGVAYPLTAVPKDAYGNIIKVTSLPAEDQKFEAVILSEELAKTTTFDITGDVFTADLVVTKVGTYNVIFKLGDAVGFTYTLTVSPGPIDTSKTLVTGVAGVAGIQTSFSVQFRDSFENVIGVDPTTSFLGTKIQRSTAGAVIVGEVPFVPTTTDGTVQLMPPMFVDGSYTSVTFAFTPIVSGKYYLTLAVAGVVTTDAASLVVNPGAASPAYSTVFTSNILGATAGVLETAQVQVKDAYQNADLTGTASVTAVPVLTTETGQSTLPVAVSWNDVTGFYDVSYTSTETGSLKLTVAIGGVFLSKSLTTSVSPGPIDATASVVTGDTVVVAGGTTPGKVTLVAKDAYGNAITTGGASVIMTKTEPLGAESPLFVTDVGDGTYTSTFTFTAVGTGSVSAKLFDMATATETLIGSVAVTVKDKSGDFSLADSSITTVKTTAAAGTTGSVTLVTKDDQLAILGVGGLHWSASAADSVTLAAVPMTYSYVDAEDGTYAFTYGITKAGTYTVTIANTATFNTTFDNTMVLGTFTATVTAGAAAGLNTVYTGIDNQVFAAGVSKDFTFDLYDTFNNKLTAAQTELELAGAVKAYYSQMGVKTPLTVSYTAGAVASGFTTLSSDSGDVFVEVTGVAKKIASVKILAAQVSGIYFSYSPPVKTAGQVYSHEVIMYDTYLNEVPGGATITGCVVTATHTDDLGATVQTPLTCTILPSSLQVSYNFTKATTYQFDYQITQLGYSTPKSFSQPNGDGYKIVVAAGPPSALTSVVEGVDTKSITAGEENFYTMTLKDAYGNGVADAKASVDGSITIGTVSSILAIPEPVNGVYQIPFGGSDSMIKEPTAVKLTVFLNGVSVSGSPYTIPIEKILPAKTSVTGSVVRYGPKVISACASTVESACTPEVQLTAGTTETIELYAYNTLGIPQVYKQEIVVASARVVAKAGQTVDAGDTGLTAEPTVVYQTGKGIYNISFSANTYEDADEEVLYAIDIQMKAGDAAFTTISSSPVYFSVKPATALPSASKIVATFSKVSNYASLSKRYLLAHNQINTLDKYGNQALYDPANPILITATAVGPTEATIIIEPILVDGVLSGQYLLGIGTPTSGTYFITIVINGVSLESYSVTIEPGTLDFTTVSLTSSNSVAGTATTGKLTGLDSFGNQLANDKMLTALTGATVTYKFKLLTKTGTTLGNDAASTFLVGAVTTPSVVDFSYTPRTEGTLEITADVTSATSETVSAFKKYTVSAGAVDVPSSTVTGPALAGFLENTPSYFSVALKDAYGNIRTDLCPDLTVSIQEATTLTTVTDYVINATTGACDVGFTLPTGTYNIGVSYLSQVISSFTSSAVAVVGDPDLASTLVAGLGYGDVTVEAGVSNTFSVSLVAANGLLVPESQGATYVQVNIVDSLGTAVTSVDVQDMLNGQYDVEYNVDLVGTYTLSLLVGGALYSTAKTVQVLPTQSFAQNVTVDAPSVVQAGDFFVDVAIQDKFGNKQTYDLYDVDAMQINVKETFETYVVEVSDVDGETGAEVTLQTAGIYTLEFYFGATLVSSGKVEVEAGDVAIGKSVVYGEGLTTAQAGVQGSFFIELIDEFDNLVSNLSTATDFVNDVTASFVRVGNASDVQPISLQVSLVQQAIKASYTLFATGDYYLSLVHTDEETTPATTTTYTSFAGYVSTTVTAGLASAETITASQIPTSPFAGYVDFQILVEDAYGNAITTDQFLNLFIVARGTGSNLGSVSIAATEDITWVGDKYTVSMFIPVSGDYQLEITRGVDTIKGSPYALTVASAPIFGSYAFVEGTGIANFTAGAAVSVTVEPRDQYNNSVPISTNEEFTLAYKYADGTEVKVTAAEQPATNTLIFTGYDVTKAEEGITAEVSYFDGLQSTLVATYTITVAPETTVSAANTIVSFSGTNVAGGSDVAVAGSSLSILVYPADQYGNAIPFTSGAGFESFLVLTGQPEPTTLDAGFVVSTGGALTYTFAPTVAGTYTGNVKYQGVNLVTPSLSLTIDTSDVVMSKTTVTGPTGAIQAGVPATIAIKFFDKYDNAITSSKAFMSDSPLSMPVKVGTQSFDALIMSRSFNVVAKEYRITVSSDKSGVMELKYIIDGIQLYETGSTPYTYTVLPGAFSTAETTVFGLDSLTAGQSEVFYIEPRDSLSNALKAQTTGALTVTTIGSITPTVTYNALTSLYEVRFTTGDAASLGLTGGVTTGTLAFEVLYDGTVFKTLSTTTFLAAGTVSATNSLMVSDTTGVAVATLPNFEKGFSTEAPVTFKISFKDTNNVAKALTTAELSNIKLTIVPSATSTTSLTPEGDVQVSFTAQTATDYSVSASYNGESIQGGAYAGFRVSAGLASGATSFVSADTKNALDATTTAAASAVGAGITSSVYVVVKDQYENLQDDSSPRANIVTTMTSDAGATADVTGALVKVKDLSLSQSVSHVYEVQYTANVAGTYKLGISLGGVTLADLPLTVSAGEFAPAQTVVADVDPVIGMTTQFALTAFDSYGNKKPSEDITFDMTFTKGTLSLASVASYSPSATPSTHSGTVTFVESGSYTLTITSGGVSVMTKDIVVKAGPVSQAASTISGLDGSIAGVATTVTIIPRDASGNLNLITPTVSFSPAGTYAETVTVSTTAVTIALTPPSFGDVVITADFEGSPIVATVSVTPSAPPVLQLAKMASLTSIEMTFDIATNMGNMGSSMDCNLVLATATVGKLGSGASCKFTTTKTLGVTLGSEASILPVGSVAPDEILIKENAIANAAGNSYNATGSSLLQAPDVLVQPVVAVMAPTTVGICEDLTVDASASSGSGGRNLAFSFQVEGLGDKIQSLSNSLKAITDTTSIAEVDKNAMNFGINYNFIVSATNFLGQTTTAKIPVYRSDVQVPTVFIAGKSHIKTEASSQIAFPCRAIMPGDFIFDSSLKSCVKNDGGDLFPVDFSWKGDKTKATFDASGLPASFAATLATRDLTLPSNYLEAGKTYGFECTGADAAAPDRKQTASVEIEVEYSAYEASILGGSREVSVSEALELQAAVNDPNDLAGVNPVRYAWDVTADYGTFKKTAAFYNDDALSSGKLSLAAGALPAGTYTFTVTASKEPLTAKRKAVSSTVTVTVKEQEVLKVSITDSLTSKVFKPSKSLSLRCEVPESALTTFAWTMTSSVGDSDLATKAFGTDLQVLTIPGGSLLPGVDYTFTCSATSTISGSSSKTISTESIPSSGKVLMSYLINNKYFADATCKIASGLGDINLVAKDWVSDSDNLYYEFHAIETTTNDDILLGTPSAENSIISSLPEGTYNIKVYIRNDLEPASAKDAVSGAVYTLMENVKVCDLNLATDTPPAGRRLLQAPANEMEQLYYRFQVGVAEGDVPKALSFGRIFGDAYGGADKTQGCDANAPITVIKNNMLASLVSMDGSVVPTNEYIGLQACAFDGLLYVPGEQVQTNVQNVHTIFSTVLGKVADPADALDIAPSSGDPYQCFYKSLDSIFNFVKLDCESKSLAETMLKPVSDTVTSLSQSMSTNTQFGTVASVDVTNFDIHASGDDTSAVLNGKYTITVNTTGVSSPFAAFIDLDDLLNDNLVLSEIISLGADQDSTASFAVNSAALAAIPAGYEPAAKYWDGTFTNGVAQFTDIPSLPEGIDAVQGVYGFDLPLTAGNNVYVILYAIEIKLGLSSLEFFAPEYSYTTATGKLTNSIQLTPPFSMKNFEYSVSVTNLQPIAEFAAQVAVEGISLSVSKDGSEYVNVTTSALAGQTPAKFVAGDIDVHEVDDCMPGTLTHATTPSCTLKNNTYEFKLEKGGESKSYYISIFRTPSTQSSLQDLKLAAASVYEQLYDVGDNKVSYNQAVTGYRAYVYSSVTSATVEVKAQANAPAPFGPGGAHISVAGPGAFGLDAIMDFGNNSAEVGSSQPDSANKHILIGQNPVTVDVTSQDGSSADAYTIDIFRMGKPVSITERFAGLNADDFINSQEAQNVFINAKAAQLGLEPYQIEILLVSSGSVIIEYVIYPVVGTIRDPAATDAERQAIDEQVTKDNIVAADAIATNVLSKAGEVLDFGEFGAGTSEIQKSATPPIPRPDDLPCPVCPAGFITTTETNSEGLSYCSCKLPAKASSDELSDGEIAGIAVGCLVFVAAVGVFSIVIYRRRRQAQQVLSGSDSEEEEETGNEGEAETEAEEGA